MSMATPVLLAMVDTTTTETIEWEPSVKPSASPTAGNGKSAKLATTVPSVAPSSDEWASSSSSWEPSGSLQSASKSKTAAPSSAKTGGSRRRNRHRG